MGMMNLGYRFLQPEISDRKTNFLHSKKWMAYLKTILKQKATASITIKGGHSGVRKPGSVTHFAGSSGAVSTARQ